MSDLILGILTVPFAGFLALALAGARLPRRVAAWVGVGSVGVAAGLSVALAAQFLLSPPPDHAVTATLWTWLSLDTFHATIGLRVDPLSLVMLLVITVVGFLIHLYSAESMGEDEGYARFFAYMNLFVGSMLVLVLADNLLLLYLGWEGVGLCSYLLIGFWYKDPANGRAAMKAFIVTRVGDAALALGLFLLYLELGTLDIAELSRLAPGQWEVGAPLAVAAAALLLGGAVGKSAQLPLQTWLPDAMAGPTPVSALIHAATMVTAGVYLIARMHVIFALAPVVQFAVAAVGAVTLLLAAVSALAQWDIKRVLAYSTISQIGYMFLALGVGAWSGAMFHFVTHACFKALLFLGAGVLIAAMHEEHSIFKMGGLRAKLPLTFWTFLAGTCSLAAVPFVTAGFYSKDEILAATFASPFGGMWLWTLGLAGALLTAVYSFRVVFVAFFGPAEHEPAVRPGWRMAAPLVVLAGLSVVAGVLNLPQTLGNLPLLDHFLEPVFADTTPLPEVPMVLERRLQLISGLVCVIGVLLSWLVYVGFRPQAAAAIDSPVARAMRRFWLAGWGFDWLYGVLFVRPYQWLARLNRADALDLIFQGLGGATTLLHRALARTQTGELRWYVAVLVFGTVILIGVVMVR